MKDFSLSQLAHDDLEEIDEYTRETWGETQRERYMTALFRQFDVLARQPRVGKHRPELGERVMSQPCLAHVVFYTVEDDTLTVVRVLHQKRDPDFAFRGTDDGPSRVSESQASYLPAWNVSTVASR